MPDGNPIIIGQANTGSNETSLSRDENTAATVFVARNLNIGDGIHGEASDDAYVGVSGINTIGTGVRGESDTSAGVRGSSSGGTGVRGRSDDSAGVSGTSSIGTGVSGTSFASGLGVWGTSASGFGVLGESSASGFLGAGVKGTSASGSGVLGESSAGDAGAAGVVGIISGATDSSNVGTGVWGQCTDPFGLAGKFVGNVEVSGNLDVDGPNKSFKIDHPLDPENKYLFHNAVEAPERKNVYDGVAELDEDGTASVDLPEWFEALNGDFRYQLTAVGGAAPNLHVAEEIYENNRFRIAGGEEGMKVCWQVTGTRKDPLAAANPFEVEQEKSEEERGRYLYPSLYDAPEEQRVVRPLAEGVAEEQRPPEPSGIDLARLEEEHRREMEELRRRMEERQEEAPPEST